MVMWICLAGWLGSVACKNGSYAKVMAYLGANENVIPVNEGVALGTNHFYLMKSESVWNLLFEENVQMKLLFEEFLISVDKSDIFVKMCRKLIRNDYSLGIFWFFFFFELYFSTGKFVEKRKK